MQKDIQNRQRFSWNRFRFTEDRETMNLTKISLTEGIGSSSLTYSPIIPIATIILVLILLVIYFRWIEPKLHKLDVGGNNGR